MVLDYILDELVAFANEKESFSITTDNFSLHIPRVDEGNYVEINGEAYWYETVDQFRDIVSTSSLWSGLSLWEIAGKVFQDRIMFYHVMLGENLCYIVRLNEEENMATLEYRESGKIVKTEVGTVEDIVDRYMDILG